MKEGSTKLVYLVKSHIPQKSHFPVDQSSNTPIPLQVVAYLLHHNAGTMGLQLNICKHSVKMNISTAQTLSP